VRPEIGVGDLLRAWDAAGRDPALVRLFARALALEPRQTDSQSAGQAPADWRLPRSPVSPIATPRPDPGEPRPPPGTYATVALHPIDAVVPAQPIWLASTALARGTKSGVQPPLPPLFKRERERALLAAVARRLRAEGEFDVPGLVQKLARLDLPSQLPRRRIPSIRGGVQLLIDRSNWMAPFHEDTTRLVDRFRAVVGDALEELSVTEAPPEVIATGGDATPRPWTPPRTGVAVVVVSDLGRTAYLRHHHRHRLGWHAFIQQVRSAGFDPIVIVPGRRGSYVETDQTLRQTLLLGWDRAARVAEVAQFRKGRR